MALRTRCVSGSTMYSLTLLSTSVVSPRVWRTTCRPAAWARSRTSRGRRANACWIGTTRTFMTRSWSSRTRRSMRVTASWSGPCTGPIRATSSATMDCETASSPTRSTRRSTFSVATRSVPPSVAASLARAAGDARRVSATSASMPRDWSRSTALVGDASPASLTSVPSASAAASSLSVTAAVTARSPLRRRVRKSSRPCVKRAMRS